MSAGRTLFGAKPAKGQQFDDHYFGAIPERVLAFMIEVDRELFKQGILAKTRHNEVAPGQFEIAPLFEKANLAHDHQQLMMTTLKKVAERYGMTCLLHEKPFNGVNGSGKHVNFSFGNSNQGNLLNPGDTPHENAQFLTFCAAIIRGVHLYGGLLRAVVASASNDFRLGANEAPPAIISIFLGDQLMDVYDQIAKGGATGSKSGGTLEVGVDTLPKLKADPGDRNRTSPFAFTGNRFEFRAPGSGQSISGPMVAINAILADSLDFIATALETELAKGVEFNDAVQLVLQGIVTDHGAVIFNGDGYSAAWQDEAAQRGLKNLRTTPDALPELADPAVVAMLDKYKVLSPRELNSRYEVYLEQYILSVHVEAVETARVGKTAILPAALRYQALLADNVAKLTAVDIPADRTMLDAVTAEITKLTTGIAALESALAHEAGDSSSLEHAHPGQGRADPADGRRARRRRRAGGAGGRRPVAAADVPGDAAHPLIGRRSVRGCRPGTRRERVFADGACHTSETSAQLGGNPFSVSSLEPRTIRWRAPARPQRVPGRTVPAAPRVHPRSPEDRCSKAPTSCWPTSRTRASRSSTSASAICPA